MDDDLFRLIHHKFSLLLWFQSDKKFCSYYYHNVYIPKIGDYLEILTGRKDFAGKGFVAISFSEYFKSMEEEQNLYKSY